MVELRIVNCQLIKTMDARYILELPFLPWFSIIEPFICPVFASNQTGIVTCFSFIIRLISVDRPRSDLLGMLFSPYIVK